ncbi:MAG: hypothetical protein KBD29_00480 [Candidatus Magasanikbacteria bacterium]|nr:hypothetical protein [Candidatus Magasanikbacteria bacterium]
MEKNLEAIARIAMRRGDKEFDKKYSLDKKRDLNKELQKVKQNIVDYVLGAIEEINWKDSQSVTDFCSSLDRIIEANQARFVTAYKRAGGVGIEEWKEFTEWLLGLRNKTKEQIMSEVNNPEVEQLIQSQLGVSSDPEPVVQKKVEPKSLVSPVTQIEKEEPRLQAESLEESKTVSKQGGLEVEKLTQEFDLPPSIIEAFQIYSEALRSGDETGAAEYLPELLKIITQLEIARKQAEQMWEDSENKAASKAQSLEETSIAISESLRESEKENKKLTQRFDSALAVIVELRKQVSDRENQIKKAEQEAQELRSRKPHVIEVKKEEVTEMDRLLEIQKNLEKAESELSVIMELLEDQSLEIVSWINDLRQKAQDEFSRRRALAETLTDQKDIKHEEARLEEIITEKEKIREEVEKKLEKNRRQKEDVMGKLQSIRKIKEMLTSSIPDDKKNKAEEQISVELPDFEQVLDNLRQKKIVEAKAKEIEKGGEGSKLFFVDNLPYTVEISSEDLTKTRQLERLFEAYKGGDEVEIKKSLPIDFKDEGETLEIKQAYFNQLVSSLSDGTFLPALEKALTVFGSFRKRNGDVMYAKASDIGNALLMGKIVLGRHGPETSKIARCMLQIDMFAEIHPGCKLVKRLRKTQWGAYFELTPLGEAASRVWTGDLLQEGTITHEQLSTIYTRKLEKFEQKIGSQDGQSE